MRWTVLVNARAGKRAIPRPRLVDALAAAGVDARIESPGDPVAMREAAVAAAGEGEIAVVGGDGSLSLVVDALITASVPRMPVLALLPSGTGCDILRTFGLPMDLEGAAAHLAGDRTYAIDVGRLDGSWGRRHFINVAQAGVGAAAAESAPRVPPAFGALRYPLAFAGRLPRFPATRVEIEAGRRSHTGRALAVILANAQFFAGGWNVAPKAMLVDGELDVQVFDVTKRQAVAVVPRVIRGTHLGFPGIRRMSLPSLSVRSDVPWPVEVDGDHIGTTPFDARVIPGAVRLKI